ncbi:MAG: glutathione-disulfide reductase [Limnothrix sp.]
MSHSQYDYDLFVIGAGSGGLSAATKAAKDGVKVAIAESSKLGGTCVNRGCVPKKLMVYAADFARQAELAADYGWQSPEHRQFDWPKFRDMMHDYIQGLNETFSDKLAKSDVEVFRGEAHFVEPHLIKVGDRQISADKILIAVGGQPNTLDIEGVELAITSRGMFQLKEIPARLAIVGGGYIGVEFAAMMSSLGSEVTLMDSSALVLSDFDEDFRRRVHTHLEQAGVTFLGETKAKEIQATKAGLKLSVTGNCNQELTVDTVLLAIGRTPNLANLNLDAVGVKTKDGAIAVDDYSQTSQANIYAVGDCTNRLQLTPVAKAEAEAFVDTVFNGDRRKVDYDWIPSAVFTHPEAATVGLTEAAAKERYKGAIEVYSSTLQPLSLGLTNSETKALIKIVVAKASQQIVGVHVVGDSAADMVQCLTVALRKGLTKQELDATIGIHPTLGEELLAF